MSLTLKQMRTRIVTRLNEQYGNPLLNGKLTAFINDAIQIISSLGPWHFMMTTGTINLVNGTVEYSLASDFQYLNDQEVRLTTTKTRLYFLDDDNFLLVVENPTTTGTPVYFRTVGSSKIQLYPVPNTAAVSAETSVTYEYCKGIVTELSGDSDTTPFPEYVDVVLLDIVEMYAKRWVKDFDGAQLANQAATASLQKLISENTELLKLRWKDVPPALKIQPFEQLTQSDRS